MINKKKIISVILVLCMLFSSVLTISASEYETYVKVSDELLGKLNVSYEDLLLGNYEDTGETYPCIIWIEDVKLEEAVEAGIDAAEQTIADDSSVAPYTYSYETTESDVATLVDVTLDDEASDEYVQTYIEAEREAAEEMYSDNNSQFVAENFMARDMSVTYVSKYSPCIFADLSVSKIADLIWESDVVNIGYSPKVEWEPCATTEDMTALDISTCYTIMRMRNAQSLYGVSGKGVKIGQIEPACPEASEVIKNPDFDATFIEYEFDEHPNDVYDIMNDIAPDATYYASALYSDGTSSAVGGNFYDQIEWLMLQGVNVINMSMSWGSELNTYNDMACWMDHITYNHDVHIVCAAGNEGANGVVTPAMAYNVITVGNTSWSNGYTIDSNSSYNNDGIGIAVKRTYKPDIVAPASCTSYATPMVTGTIALMCELQPSLKTKQPIVKSILAAGAGANTVRFQTTDADFARYGAGIVDTWAALYIVGAGRYSQATGVLSSSNTSQTYTMNVTADDSVMRIAVSNTNYVNFATSSNHASATIPDGTIADLGIAIYDSNGNLLMRMPINLDTIGANLKVIHWPTNGRTGNFTIKVSLLTAPSGNRSTNFGVAWW